MKYLHYTIIHHYDESFVLMVHTDEGWTLPCYELPMRVDFEAKAINEAVEAQFKTRVLTLRQVCRQYNEAHQEVAKVHIMENLEREWFLPDYAAWVNLDDMKRLELYRPEHLPLIEDYFNEVENPTYPPLRPVWAYEQWYWGAHRWVVEQMRLRESALIAPLEQLRSWAVSCLLRAKTVWGTYYLKASNPHYGHEAAITQLLVERFPENLPKIAEILPEQNILLLLDFGDTVLEHVEDISLWEKALHQYALLQLESGKIIDDLLEAGCADRRLAKLAQRIDTVFGDKEALHVGNGINEADYNRLQTLIPKLKAKLHELDGYGLPYTIEHGDFHARNVAVQAGRVIFFDWTGANISHPFFSMFFFLEFDNPFEEDLPGWDARFREAYLPVWSEYGNEAHLNAAFELAMQLSPLIQVLHYANLFHQTEGCCRWELAGVLPFYIHKILKIFGDSQ
jgi:Phosphotransferase enzyme family